MSAVVVDSALIGRRRDYCSDRLPLIWKPCIARDDLGGSRTNSCRLEFANRLEHFSCFGAEEGPGVNGSSCGVATSHVGGDFQSRNRHRVGVACVPNYRCKTKAKERGRLRFVVGDFVDGVQEPSEVDRDVSPEPMEEVGDGGNP